MRLLSYPLLPFLWTFLFLARIAAAENFVDLEAADDRRINATVQADTGTLSALFSKELRYAHSNGNVDNQDSFLEGLTSGSLKYQSFTYQQRQFQWAAPGVALMTGRAQVRTGSNLGGAEMLLAFLAVWRIENGQWRFLAWQSCRLPPAP
jgi:hypothetical protein